MRKTQYEFKLAVSTPELESAALLMASRFAEDPGVVSQLTGIAGCPEGGPVTCRAWDVFYKQCLVQLQGFAAKDAVHILTRGENSDEVCGLLLGYEGAELPGRVLYPILLRAGLGFRRLLTREEWRLIKKNTKAYSRSAPKPSWKKKCCGERYYYIQVLAMDKGCKGSGAFRRMIGPLLEDCDKRAIPVALETCNAANIPLYEHFGFTVISAKENPVFNFSETCLVRWPSSPYT